MRICKDRNRNGGFTLVETLLTVAILVILLGLSAVGVARYKDYLKITELDNAARDIYMAAENRAVLLQNSGATVALLGAGGPGAGPVLLSSSETADAGKLADLLPTGSIDPALRNGKFVVIYDGSTHHVKEVFYAEGDFGSSTPSGYSDPLDPFRETRSKRVSEFRSKITDRLVGHYDGSAADNIGTKPLPTPGVEVLITNGEELILTVTYTLPDDLPAGVSKTHTVELYYPADSTVSCKFTVSESDLVSSGNTATYERVLDSLKNGQFRDLEFKDSDGSAVSPALGGDFKVTAGLTLKNDADGYIPSAYYAEATDNSLFDTSTHNGDTAYIANLRHLQNLDKENSFKSGVGGIENAKQLCDIDCRDYKRQSGEHPDSKLPLRPH